MMSDTRFSLSIVTIATGASYHKMLLDLIHDLSKLREYRLQLFVFSDLPQEAWPTKSELGFDLIVIEWPVYAWPEVTMKRFEAVYSLKSRIDTDFVMWLDADMRAHRLPDLSKLRQDVMYFARHPGFQTPIRIDLSNLSPALRAIRNRLMAIVKLKGLGLGTWENRTASKAFVPFFSRRQYVHGAAWLGTTKRLMEFAWQMNSCQNEDLRKGIIPIWHDESMINSHHSKNPSRLLPRGFSHWVGNPLLSPYEKFFESVEKRREQG